MQYSSRQFAVKRLNAKRTLEILNLSRLTPCCLPTNRVQTTEVYEQQAVDHRRNFLSNCLINSILL